MTNNPETEVYEELDEEVTYQDKIKIPGKVNDIILNNEMVEIKLSKHTENFMNAKYPLNYSSIYDDNDGYYNIGDKVILTLLVNKYEGYYKIIKVVKV